MKMLCGVSVLLLLANAVSAATLEVSRRPVAAPESLPGLYTLILIGEGGGSSDAERVAILDQEGDGLSFDKAGLGKTR